MRWVISTTFAARRANLSPGKSAWRRGAVSATMKAVPTLLPLVASLGLALAPPVAAAGPPVAELARIVAPVPGTELVAGVAYKLVARRKTTGTSKVEFYDGDVRLGEANANLELDGVVFRPGLHAIITVSTGANGQRKSSRPAMVVATGDIYGSR